MKKLVIVVSFILFLGCNKEDDNSNSTEKLPEGISQISGEVKLPEDVSVDVNTLTVQSFSDLNKVTNGEYTIQIVDQSINNLYVVDSTNKVWLMANLFPEQTDYTINSESTLLALLMNFPAVQNLSYQGKFDLIEIIKNHPSFLDLTKELEIMLSSGISPLEEGQETFANNLFKIIEDIASSSRSEDSENITKTSEIYEGPIKIYQAENEFIFQNPGNGYTSYVGIYRTDPITEDTEEYAYFPLPRVTFFPTSLSEMYNIIANGLIIDHEIVEIPYSLSEPGTYKIIARSGKSYSDGTVEAKDAYVSNMKAVAMDILINLIPTNKDHDLQCYQFIVGSFGDALAMTSELPNSNGSPRQSLFNAYSLVGSYLSKLISDGNLNALDCLGPNNSKTYKYLKTLKDNIAGLKYLSIAGNSANLAIGLWQKDKNSSSLDVCFTVTENSIYECQPGLKITGNLDFGEVPVGVEVKRTVYIENQADFTINITSLDLPESFTIIDNPDSVPPEESEELTIAFMPTQLREYSGEFTIQDDIDQEQVLDVSGKGIKAFEINGNLDFGIIEINGPPAEGTISIDNLSDETINVTTLGWPSEFIYAWSNDSNGTIEANGSVEIQVSYFPREVQNLSGTIHFTNDASEISEELNYSVSVIDGGISLSGDLNFGDVLVNTTATKSLIITNNSSVPIEIYGFSMPNGFTYSGYTGTIEANETESFDILFQPSEVKTYAGEISVNHSGIDETTTINILGNGINENSSSERLYVYISYDKIIEINMTDGSKVKDVINLGDGYFSGFTYLKHSKKIIAKEWDTYEVDLESKNLSILTTKTYDRYIVSNTQNRLFGFSSNYDKLIEINIDNGNEIQEINLTPDTDLDLAFLEKSQEIIGQNYKGIFKLNIDTHGINQLFVDHNFNVYEDLFVSNSQNRLFAFRHGENPRGIIELDINTGRELKLITDFGTEYYSNFVFSEEQNQIFCSSNNGTFKIDVDTGEIIQISPTYYESYLLIN